MYGGEDGSSQSRWNEDYAREYVRLSLLGVHNINDLTECTKVLPAFTGLTFTNPDAEQMARYASGELTGSHAYAALEAGDMIP
ncbi:hypothetical protein NQ176_g11403 [Zarea fungicola]|uniref:Uncharacterized protein n=1 Tax=Zarea fungicola TaxID=93591 RepID=A0ACC1MCI2_9HYPO|nr:hypothetical protein NQ176_g11403 [Lecanicillium fungicola]